MKHTAGEAASLPPDTGFRIRACAKKKHFMEDYNQEEMKQSPVLSQITKKKQKHIPDPIMFEGGFNAKQLSSRGYIPRQSAFSKAFGSQEPQDTNTGSSENLHTPALPKMQLPNLPRMNRGQDPDSAGGPGPINPFFQKESNHAYNHWKQTQMYNYDMEPKRQHYY